MRVLKELIDKQLTGREEGMKEKAEIKGKELQHAMAIQTGDCVQKS